MAVNQFNNTTTKDGLIQKCEITLFGDNGLGKITGNTNLLYIFANFANEALDWYGELALKYSSNWSFDSSTYTTIPQAFTDINSGQADYTLDVNFLNISNVEIQDSNGVFTKLNKITDDEIAVSGESPTQYGNVSGTPTQYKYIGNSLILIPKPNYTLSNGLKLTIERGFAYFTYDDTTDSVGIPLSHCRYISDYMSWLYARDRSMTKIATELEKRKIQYEMVDIPNHYSSRDKDQKPTMKSLPQNNK